jgi:hypothetical protein
VGTSSPYSPTAIPAIVDPLSVTLVYTTLPQSIPLINNIGYHTKSGISGTQNVPPYASYYLNPYDHTASIISSSLELQIFNGRFQTRGTTTNGYLNYSTYKYGPSSTNSLDYSTTNIPATGYRYATFVWKVNSGATYTTLTFTINNTNIALTNNSNDGAGIGATPIQLFYKIEDSSGPTPPAVATNGIYTTAWINGNSKVGIYTSAGNYNLPSNYQSAQYVGLKSITLNGTTSTLFTETLPFAFIPASTSYIYCRIGLPMNLDFGFQSVTCGLS